MMFTLPTSDAISDKKAEHCLQQLDLSRQQADLNHSLQTQQIKMLKEEIYNSHPRLIPYGYDPHSVMVPVAKFLRYLSQRIDSENKQLANLCDKPELPIDVSYSLRQISIQFRHIMLAILHVNCQENDHSIKIPVSVYNDMMKHFKHSLPLEPAPLQFLRDSNKEFYDQFMPVFEQLLDELRRFQFGAGLADHALEILLRPTANELQLVKNLCEAGIRLYYFPEAHELIERLKRMIQEEHENAIKRQQEEIARLEAKLTEQTTDE